MKAGRIIVSGLVAIVAIIAIAVVVVLGNLNSIVKTAIETVGTDTLKTNVSVAEVDIVLTEGKGAISGLNIANLPGFSGGNIVGIGGVGLQIDTASITSEVKVIKDVFLEGVELKVDHKGLVDTNVQALIDNLPSGSSEPAPEPAAEPEPGADVLLAINSVRVGETKIALSSEKWGDRTVTLPGYTQTNIGSAEQGVTPGEVGTIVMKEMLSRAQKAVVKDLKKLAKSEVEDKLKEKLKDELKNNEALQDLEQKIDKDKLKSLFK